MRHAPCAMLAIESNAAFYFYKKAKRLKRLKL
jgi:hypothetical protein